MLRELGQWFRRPFSFTRLLNNGVKCRTYRRCRKHRPALSLELLEDRTLLAVPALPSALADSLPGRLLAEMGLSRPSSPVRPSDKTGPAIVLDRMASKLITNTNLKVTGRVTDESGVAWLRVRVDAGHFVKVPLGKNGRFSFTTHLPLDGSADGTHKLFFRAKDKRGNLSKQLVRPFTLDTSLIQNRAVTTDPGVQQMPSVAVNPRDSRHVVIAYMDYSLPTADAPLPGEGYAGIGVAVSRDNGVTWKQSTIPLPVGFDEGAANPIAKFDDQGHVFVTFMSVTFLGARKPPLTNGDFVNANFESDRAPGFEANNGIFVARSEDGGNSWNPAVAVASHFYNPGGERVPFEVIPDLAIDRFRQLPGGGLNPNYGDLYVTWTRLYPEGQVPGFPDLGASGEIMIAVSKDRGVTWETQYQQPPEPGLEISVLRDPTQIVPNLPGTTSMDQAHVSIGPEGDIYVSNAGGGDFVVQHSTDAGATFTLPGHDTGEGLAFGTGASTFSDTRLPNNRFRTHPIRAIAADPRRPGHVYAVEPVKVLDSAGVRLDPADVFFARSTDYGQSWEHTRLVAPDTVVPIIVNDDNGGQPVKGTATDEVAVSQALPRLAVDAEGNISVIWLDARRDPADHLLDVFGTVSSDGGLSFSPNFRLTDISFDADQGRFVDATGHDNYYLGDFLGLALANKTAYASWTDTRHGNQDVFFAHYRLDPAPAPPNDRFEPNDRSQTATKLGRVIQRVLAKLAAPVGDQDWFRVEAAATGNLIVRALVSGGTPPDALRLELWDDLGRRRLATGSALLDDAGVVIGHEIIFPGIAGQEFLARVVGQRPVAVRSNCPRPSGLFLAPAIAHGGPGDARLRPGERGD